jgi:hypothetical protein
MQVIFMKSALISTLPMFLLFGAIAPASAQPGHDRQEQDKSEKQRGAPPQQQHAQQPPQQQRAPQSQPQQQLAQQAPQQRAQPPQQQQRAQEPQPQQRAQQPQPQQQRAQQAPQQQREPQSQPQQQHVQQAPQQRAQLPQQQQRAQEPQPQQQRAQQSQPQQRRAQQAPQQQRAQQAPQRTEQEARVWQQQSGWSQQGAWQQHTTWQQDRSSHWQTDHRTWGERGGYGGYYIPQDRFGLYFGAGHWFRIQSQPIIVAGYPRFQYGGYSFMMVDPWPSDWAPNWYAIDDVYVGYNNGYYLYNRMHPGEAMAITVVL